MLNLVTQKLFILLKVMVEISATLVSIVDNSVTFYSQNQFRQSNSSIHYCARKVILFTAVREQQLDLSRVQLNDLNKFYSNLISNNLPEQRMRFKMSGFLAICIRDT